MLRLSGVSGGTASPRVSRAPAGSGLLYSARIYSHAITHVPLSSSTAISWLHLLFIPRSPGPSLPSHNRHLRRVPSPAEKRCVSRGQTFGTCILPSFTSGQYGRSYSPPRAAPAHHTYITSHVTKFGTLSHAQPRGACCAGHHCCHACYLPSFCLLFFPVPC